MSQVLRLPISNVPAGGDYTAAVALGSAGTQVQLLLDTGSSSLGVIPKSYDPSADTSLTTTTLAQDVVYGTGGWAGPVVKTTVAMGGATAAAIDSYVALIDAEYEGFGQADGIIGLAYNGLNQAFNMASYLEAHGGKTSTYPWPFRIKGSSPAIRRFLKLIEKMPVEEPTPYFTELESAGVIANMFAFYTLRSFPSAASANPAGDPLNAGFFILGGGPGENDLYEGEFQDVAVVDDHYYNVDLLAVQVGEAGASPVAALSTQDAELGSNAIVDSGTNSLVLSPDVYTAVIDGLSRLDAAFGPAIQSGSQPGGIDQTQLDLGDWPTVSFILRGPSGSPVKLDCAPSTYWQFDTGKAGQAVFQIASSGMPLSILGLPLFNNYYTVFDRSEDAKGVIRFATITHTTTTPAGS